MGITWEAFGTTKDGTPVRRYLLQDEKITVGILTYGGILQSFYVPDKQGNLVDIVLGFDTPQGYQNQTSYLGALIGRCANRIEKGTFSINGKTYKVACNDNGINHLHGGLEGFDAKHWEPEVKDNRLLLRYYSKDGEEGYPGNLSVTVSYWVEQNALHIDYQAICDKDTICNLTNHAYFNLSGHQSGEVGEQMIQIFAHAYTPLNENNVPMGKICEVEDTPLDLRIPKRIGEGWDSAHEQIVQAGGYDHNFVLDGIGMRPVAKASSHQTGISLVVETDLPGIQFYTGNFLDSTLPIGKQKAKYDKRNGFCLETQSFPNFPVWSLEQQPILKANVSYHAHTVFKVQIV